MKFFNNILYQTLEHLKLNINSYVYALSNCSFGHKIIVKLFVNRDKLSDCCMLHL